MPEKQSILDKTLQEMIGNSDPKFDYTPEDCRELFNEIDSYIQRIKEFPESQEFVAQETQLKEKIREIGFRPASSLFILGIK